MAWTDMTREQHRRAGLRYPSDLTDAEWAVVAPLLWQSINHLLVMTARELDGAAPGDTDARGRRRSELARQTTRRIGLIDLEALADPMPRKRRGRNISPAVRRSSASITSMPRAYPPAAG